MSKSCDFKSWKTGIQWDICFPYTSNLRLCENASMFFKQLDHHPANTIAWSKSCSGTMPHWVPWRPAHHLVALVLTHLLHSQEQLHNLHSGHDSNPDLLVHEANERVLDPDIPTTMYPWKKKNWWKKPKQQNPNTNLSTLNPQEHKVNMTWWEANGFVEDGRRKNENIYESSWWTTSNKCNNGIYT